MLLPAFALLFIFNYIPMYGLIIAFQDYQPQYGFTGSPFVGLKWFRQLFSMPDFSQILINTVVIACFKILLVQCCALIFALLLNEIYGVRFKKGIQTVVYMPHFLSWVVIGGIFIDILSVKGIVNQIIGKLGINSIFFLGSNTWFRPVMVITEVWKEFGWAAILYLAALTTINPELYESAYIDGATRIKRVKYITIPGIASTIALLFILDLSNVLNAGFEQILMMYNPVVYRTGDIIDTYVYRVGLIDAQFCLATAVGMFKSVISGMLVFISYKLAYKYANYRIF
jgi:putative aldouronate transport system permease protein